MRSIKINREQINKLYEIITHFKEINNFIIEADSSSGIGTGLSVKFDLFKKNDTVVDITDVKVW